MKTKTQYSLTILSLLSLMAINYYVSSSTVKYDIRKKEETKIVEDKKIDKEEIEEKKKQITKKQNSDRFVSNSTVSSPSLFELSNQLGAPIITETEGELSYPE